MIFTDICKKVSDLTQQPVDWGQVKRVIAEIEANADHTRYAIEDEVVRDECEELLILALMREFYTSKCRHIRPSTTPNHKLSRRVSSLKMEGLNEYN